MPKLVVEYLPVSSASYGSYTMLKLKGLTVKELKSKPELMNMMQENFGDRFVIVREEEGSSERDYFLNEHIIGIPTPEFERQIISGEWQEKKIEVH